MKKRKHYGDFIMSTIASQITSLTIVYSTVFSDADQRKHQSSTSLAFVRGIHRGPVNSPHKWPVTRKMFPFDDVIMTTQELHLLWYSGTVWILPDATNSIRFRPVLYIKMCFPGDFDYFGSACFTCLYFVFSQPPAFINLWHMLVSYFYFNQQFASVLPNIHVF